MKAYEVIPGINGGVNINERSDRGVHDLTLRVQRFSESDVFMNSLARQSPPVVINGSAKENYPEMVWCDDPAPSYADDPDDAVKYVRADIHEFALKRQGNAAKTGMDAANKDAIWREENAKRMLSQSNPTALESELAANADLTAENELLQDALISQGKMLSRIVNITKGPPEEGSLHSTHDAVESVERLQARVAELEDLFKYAQVQSGVCMCGEEMHKHGYFSDHTPFDVWDHAVDKTNEAGSTGAFILRKQAEAIDAFLNHPVNFDIHDPAAIIKKLKVECKRLRNEAEMAGGGA